LFKESYRLCIKKFGTEKEARAQQRAVDPLMNEGTNDQIMENKTVQQRYVSHMRDRRTARRSVIGNPE
jgi:hypothetical protein